MIISKLYEALINNYYPTHANTRINTGGPKGPREPNWFAIILSITLLILVFTITYNLYFIS